MGRQMLKRSLVRVWNWSKALRIRHVNLFFAMAISLAGAVVIAIVAALLLAPWLNVGTQKTPPADLTRLSLTIAAGVGGVVALVVAYRRQRDNEQARFVEGFGAAAKQLGDADVAVRLAGVYAMAGVADQASKLKRQQSIDVLCGYLRLPYSPALGNNHQSARTLKLHREGTSGEELHFQFRQNDKEVRQTIVRIIAGHLQKRSACSWSSNNFDFTGAHFEGADFKEAIFSGENTSFEGATFSTNTSFEGATFSANTSFESATFTANTSFRSAIFSAKDTSFQSAIFSGATTSFDDASFSGKTTSFAWATFSGERTSFLNAIFSGEDTTFGGATFTGKRTLFARAVFAGEGTSFDEAIFAGPDISFEMTNFGDVVLRRATFSGLHTSFKGATFGGIVSFEHPKVWDPAPAFDWDEAPSSKPTNVEPKRWPPRIRRW
jgi:uncharacterized protein YjbI with pentapeptide repeats